MTLHINTNQCSVCLRIIDTKHQCIEIPNVFDFEMNVCVNLCSKCASLFDWFVNQYLKLYEEQIIKLKEQQHHLTSKIQRGMR